MPRLLTYSALALAAWTSVAAALGGDKCITFDENSSNSNNLFKIAKSDQGAATVLTSSDDVGAIHIAAATWADDVERVTGVRPTIVNDTLPAGTNNPVVVGSLASNLVSGVNSSTLDSWKSQLQGKWESYATGVVANPMAGVDSALMIVGSDKRGTIFGLYELSEQMGVSPWYWWADVPVQQQTCIWFMKDQVCQHDEPTVKYRGIFINDEAPALTGWAIDHFDIPRNSPTFLPAMYGKVFELLLRLKMNYLWPAMWAASFDVDGLPNITKAGGLPNPPVAGPNQVLADAYGVTMGTSHQEPMARNTPEWNEFGTGPWNFTVNADVLESFWTYGAERAKGVDTMYTVGMRGNGDLPLPGANIPIMENITAAQQSILKKVYNTSDISDLPQMWCMYKEVMSYYATGLQVPEDIIVLLADDNWGNLMATLPAGDSHMGGIYYHFDYVGDPRDYKWINTVNLAKTWEQLNLAVSMNTTALWVFNVGDLKPLETPIDFAANIAYDFKRWPRNSVMDYLTAYATREFGADHASEIARIVMLYSKYNSMLKPELVNSTSYSLFNFEEADNYVARWQDITDSAWNIYNSLDSSLQPAFYELVLGPTALSANLGQMHVAAGKSNLYALQSFTSANLWAQRAMDHFGNDHWLTQQYHQLLDGKWNNIMSQPHTYYAPGYWQQPMRNQLPPVSYVQAAQGFYPGTVGYARYSVEGSAGAWPGDNQNNCAQGYSCPDPIMKPMDPYGAQTRWVGVNSAGPMNVTWMATPNATWLNVSQTSGELAGDGSADTKVYIGVDWSKVNASQVGTVNFTSSDGQTTIISVPVNVTAAPPADFVGFVEGDGYVVMEAEHAQQNTTVNGYAFQTIDYYGKSFSGVEMYAPGDLATNVNMTLGQGPYLGYDFWTSGDAMANGTVKITVQIGPTLNFILGQQLMFGLELDGNATAVTPIPPSSPGSLPKDWLSIVAAEVRNVTMTLPLQNWSTPGKHSLKLWGMTAGVIFERIWVDMGGITSRGYSYLGPPESKIMGM